jgi:asparagine synthase (glutamine-hydrolysing)
MKWGEKCIEKFNGMWAFVIYDSRKNIIFGARDRFGVKPFYYFLGQNYFAFASEIKAILKLPFVQKSINPSAVFDYLILGMEEIEEESFFKNILELRPSHAFTFDLSCNKFTKWKYYTLEYTDRWEKFKSNSAAEYISEIQNLLIRSVEIRLRSDVPVGSCLSGGIDSSTIVCIINRLLQKKSIGEVGKQQRVFTVGHEVEEIDERKWAAMIVDHTRALHQISIPKSDELQNDIEDLVRTQDFPFGSTSIYAQYRVMKMAKEAGIKVLLDGQGGDELFAGYKGFYGVYAFEILKNMDFYTFAREYKHIGNAAVGSRALLSFLCKVFAANIIPKSLMQFSIKSLIRESGYIKPEFWNKYKYRLEVIENKTQKSLNQALNRYMSFNLKTLLRYEDRNSMRHSIECRTPFADDINLIEYLSKIPAVYKIHNGWSKYLLRQAAKDIIPEKIRTRTDKIGFATPENLWIAQSKHLIQENLTEGLSEYININKLIKDWNFLTAGPNNIWRFINFVIWKKIYNL